MQGSTVGFVRALVLLVAATVAGWSCASGPDDDPPQGDGTIPPPISQPCDSDRECEPFGLKCDPLHGCVPCVFDWHCAEGERCAAEGCQVPNACETDADCAGLDATPHCDPVLDECVTCRQESDCPENAHCVERKCSSFIPCVNSRDCPSGTVCDRDAGECVECMQDGDCKEEIETCVATHCVPTCESDKDCVSGNQLCAYDKGYCADCVEQEDCPSIYFCDQDRCKLDVCKPGTTLCLDSRTQAVCNALGSGYDSVVCPVSTSCAESGGAALCQPWICTPGTADCDAGGELLATCAVDGLSIADEVDCAANGQACHLAQCLPKICEPGTLFCSGKEIHECTAGGTASTLLSTCSSWQYCDEVSATCATQVCTPNEALCDDGVATVCDEAGSGPAPDGTECGDDEICYDGDCRAVICSGAFCQDGDAWVCLDEGTYAEFDDECSANQYCDSGACISDTCIADAPTCNGDVLTTCKADGSGPIAGGSDCTADDKVCEGGAYPCDRPRSRSGAPGPVRSDAYDRRKDAARSCRQVCGRTGGPCARAR
jgi:hypothetical protein